MVLKPCPYLRMRQTKTYTLFKAQTRKWHPIHENKQKNRKNLTTTQTFIKLLSYYLTGYFRFNRWFVSHASIWALTHLNFCWHNNGTLSEVINIWKSYMWSREWRIIWMKIIAVIYATFAAAKRKPEKKIRLVRDSNPWPLRYRCSDDLHSYNSSLRSSNIWFSYIYNFVIILSRVYNEPIQRPAPSWLVSLIGRGLHRYRSGQGFVSRTSLDFFQAFFSQLQKLPI